MNNSGEFEHIGECHIFFGSMFSGKSTHVLNEATSHADTGNSVLYINHISDVRDTEQQDDFFTTHSSGFRQLSHKITPLKVSTLSEIPESTILEHSIIAIDEGQFFEDIVPVVRNWMLNLNRIVYIASLDGDFRMLPFGKVHELICISTTCLKLPARCTLCQHKVGNRTYTAAAYYTAKIDGDINKINDVGGKEKYAPACLSCQRKQITKMSLKK